MGPAPRHSVETRTARSASCVTIYQQALRCAEENAMLIDPHPVSVPPRWGLSSLDWHAHALDEDADHPYGV
jgi:hypothetical protein